VAVGKFYRFSPAENPQAGDGPALASRGLPGVLALEVTVVRRGGTTTGFRDGGDRRGQHCQKAVPRRHPQADREP
jgi:hypothetical protein